MLSAKVFLALLLISFSQQLWAETVAAVQWKAEEQVYQSKEHFEEAVIKVLDQCGPADLVIFPEYSSAFTAFFISSGIDKSSLIESSFRVREYLDNFWATQAVQRGIWILPGTYLEAEEDRLYNTALLYNPLGEEILSQRKCYLGDPEEEFGLSPGIVEETTPFLINDKRIVLTICRDTYKPYWENILPEVDLWIDIKANELTYSLEDYEKALPSRLLNHGTDQGVTLSLVGSMLGYDFTGYSTWYNHDKAVLQTWSLDKQTILFFPLEQSND